MKVLIVYDTSKDNCRKLHSLLKKYLLWNQRSCFEGELTEAEFFEIKKLVEKTRDITSHVCYYVWKDPKTFQKHEEGNPKGFTGNQI